MKGSSILFLENPCMPRGSHTHSYFEEHPFTLNPSPRLVLNLGLGLGVYGSGLRGGVQV